jgi:hypothetical protein
MAQPTWNTTAGSIGSFPYGIAMSFTLSASAVSPATSVTYSLLAATLPNNIVLNTTTGILSGTPALVIQDTTTTFAVRATDNLGNISDRTFNMTVTGSATPSFTTPQGSLISVQDSTWTQVYVNYYNPDTNNPVVVELQSGILPPGLELASSGLIQGYAEPPIVEVSLTGFTTFGLSTSATNNYIYSDNIIGVVVGRPVTFTDTIGGLSAGITYYVSYVDVVASAFSVTTTQFGATLQLTNDYGAMNISFLETVQGEPTIRTYSFTLRLLSLLGGNTASYTITVINQNAPVSQGGPGNPPNTRIPTILNTRPLTIRVTDTDPYYGYYVLPPISPSTNAQIGTIDSGNFFAFKILGYDFDGNTLQYLFSNMPTWLSGDTNTGWITGNPYLASPGINNYDFTVSVYRANASFISSVNFRYAFNLSLDVTDVITWTTPSNLGTVYNATVSTLSVNALADTPLLYRLESGTLPPNLQLLSNGEIVGVVADQPIDMLLSKGASTDFTFTITAYSPSFPVVTSNKTFTVTVFQEFGYPTDILYIQAAPSINDREILRTLLDSESLIPTSSLYRPDDIYFGKATSVIYEHAYGIYASNIQEYIVAVTQNHYWRNITLGELKTAVARNSVTNEIIYEVVYSEVIDNLINPQGISVESTIQWPRKINLNLGPWYTSSTTIRTSWIEKLGQEYYTSLSTGTTRILHPNSLYNMRNRVADILGLEPNSNLLPLWMTSQQANGSTLGYTQAWVICYTKPGLASAIKTNIETNWPYTLNQINFNLDRFTVDKSQTYDFDNYLVPPAWTGLPSADPTPVPLNSEDFFVLFPRETILPNE